MKDLFRRIHITAWPIWLKLLAGFLTAVAIPLALLIGLTVNTVQQVGSQNVQTFVAETSTYQAQALSTALTQAAAAVSDFVGNDTNLTRLRTVLPTSETVVVGERTLNQVALEIQKQFFNISNPIFTEINLVNAGGQSVIQAQPNAVLMNGPRMSNNPAYRQAVQAQMLGQTQVLSIDVNTSSQPLLDIVQVLRVGVPASGETLVIGYLIAQIDPQIVIFDHLAVDSQLLDAASRLVTRRGIEISPDSARVVANLDVNIALLDDAINGRPQVEIINRSGVEVVRHYVAINNTPFVLVTENASNTVASQIVNFIIGRGFALVVGIIFLITVLVILANQLLTPPLRRISQAVQAMGRGNYNMALPDTHRIDEIGELAGSVADMRQQVLEMITNLEQRIEARGRDMSATREISHAAATQRDLQQLMEQVVNLIVERFPNIYHAQVFLLDAENRYAALRASTGEAGRLLLARGHRLAVGSISVIGRTTETGEMVVARNTDASAVHRRNELLPDTLAELAIPLRVGDRVIGALDVQSKQSDAFDTEQMEVLQTMADQVAVAIENARLYAESLRRLEALEQNRRESTLQAWHETMNTFRTRQLESTAGITPISGYHDDLRQDALRRGEVVVGKATEHQTIPIAVPIGLRGQLLGVVEWEIPQAEFDQNKVQLAQDLTDRLAVNLENARLFQESQRATQRERLVNEISARLTTQNDIDQILQAAVREVGMALRAPHVSIRLSPQAQTNGHHQNGHSDEQGESQ